MERHNPNNRPSSKNANKPTSTKKSGKNKKSNKNKNVNKAVSTENTAISITGTTGTTSSGATGTGSAAVTVKPASEIKLVKPAKVAEEHLLPYPEYMSKEMKILASLENMKELYKLKQRLEPLKESVFENIEKLELEIKDIEELKGVLSDEELAKLKKGKEKEKAKELEKINKINDAIEYFKDIQPLTEEESRRLEDLKKLKEYLVDTFGENSEILCSYYEAIQKEIEILERFEKEHILPYEGIVRLRKLKALASEISGCNKEHVFRLHKKEHGYFYNRFKRSRYGTIPPFGQLFVYLERVYPVFRKVIKDIRIGFYNLSARMEPPIPEIEHPRLVYIKSSGSNAPPQARFEDKNTIYIDGCLAAYYLHQLEAFIAMLQKVYEKYPDYSYGHDFSFFFSEDNYKKKGLVLYIWLWDSRVAAKIIGTRAAWTGMKSDEFNFDDVLKIRVDKEIYHKMEKGEYNYGIGIQEMIDNKALSVLRKKAINKVTGVTETTDYYLQLNFNQARLSRTLGSNYRWDRVIIPGIPKNIDKTVLRNFLKDIYGRFAPTVAYDTRIELTTKYPTRPESVIKEDVEKILKEQGIDRYVRKYPLVSFIDAYEFVETHSEKVTSGEKETSKALTIKETKYLYPYRGNEEMKDTMVAVIQFYPNKADAFIATLIAPRVSINHKIYNAVNLPKTSRAPRTKGTQFIQSSSSYSSKQPPSELIVGSMLHFEGDFWNNSYLGYMVSPYLQPRNFRLGVKLAMDWSDKLMSELNTLLEKFEGLNVEQARMTPILSPSMVPKNPIAGCPCEGVILLRPIEAFFIQGTASEVDKWIREEEEEDRESGSEEEQGNAKYYRSSSSGSSGQKPYSGSENVSLYPQGRSSNPNVSKVVHPTNIERPSFPSQSLPTTSKSWEELIEEESTGYPETPSEEAPVHKPYSGSENISLYPQRKGPSNTSSTTNTSVTRSFHPLNVERPTVSSTLSETRRKETMPREEKKGSEEPSWRRNVSSQERRESLIPEGKQEEEEPWQNIPPPRKPPRRRY